MPPSISAPARQIKIEPLTESSFSSFGTVIQNPSNSQNPTTMKSISANQGSAQKYIDISHITNFYSLSPSRNPAKPVMNMFVCSPRKLRVRKAESHLTTDQLHGIKQEKVFDIEILERHPYTPQTFIPMGLSRDDMSTQYLVIVASTLPSISTSSNYPTPAAPETSAEWPKGPGMPDLQNVRAFLADGSQGVTYGAGTWHAPMVVVGKKKVDFVVVQYANGVGNEDCQEILLEKGVGEGLTVAVEMVPMSAEDGKRMASLRAKL